MNTYRQASVTETPSAFNESLQPLTGLFEAKLIPQLTATAPNDDDDSRCLNSYFTFNYYTMNEEVTATVTVIHQGQVRLVPQMNGCRCSWSRPSGVPLQARYPAGQRAAGT